MNLLCYIMCCRRNPQAVEVAVNKSKFAAHVQIDTSIFHVSYVHTIQVTTTKTTTTVASSSTTATCAKPQTESSNNYLREGRGKERRGERKKDAATATRRKNKSRSKRMRTYLYVLLLPSSHSETVEQAKEHHFNYILPYTHTRVNSKGKSTISL